MLNRRSFLPAMGAGGLFFTRPGAFAQELTLTPAQTEGPYYPDRLPLDQDNDLLVLNDNITPAVGTVAWVSGRVLDRTGAPVRGAVVEIWQADNFGSYIHSRGVLGGQRDGNFQGYGRFETASNGEYLFRTIKPGLYPGRVRHVHYKVTLPNRQSLTTQLYVAGETGSDGVLNGIANAAQRASVIRPWVPIADSRVGALAANFDLILGFTPPETPAPSRPSIVAVTSAATLGSGASAGSWVSIFGHGLSSPAVTIDEQPAVVQFANDTQTNVLVPDTAREGSVPVRVSTEGGASEPSMVSVQRFLPGFFQFPQEYIAAVHADGRYVSAAAPGETILLFGTGFGPAGTAAQVRVRVHNVEAPLQYAGMVSAGLYQFNVVVPDLEDGDYPVTAQVDGVRTAKTVKLRVASTAPASASRLRQNQLPEQILERVLRRLA